MRKLAFGAIAVLVLTLFGMAASLAQPYGGPGMMGGGGGGPGWGPGMMGYGNGPGMMSWRGGRGACVGNMGSMASWRMDRIEKVVRPTAEQRPAYEKLWTAMKEATDNAQTACAADFPKTTPERLEFMEKRMSVMLTNMASIRTAFQTFYDTLNADQRARLDTSWPGRGWGWR